MGYVIYLARLLPINPFLQVFILTLISEVHVFKYRVFKNLNFVWHLSALWRYI